MEQPENLVIRVAIVSDKKLDNVNERTFLKLVRQFLNTLYLRNRKATPHLLLCAERGIDQYLIRYASALNLAFDLYMPFAVDRFTRNWDARDVLSLQKYLYMAKDTHVACDFGDDNEYKLFDDMLIESCINLVFWNGKKSGNTFEFIKRCLEGEHEIYNALNDFKRVEKEDAEISYD